MIPATITHVQVPTFTTENDSDSMATQSTHPCHRLSIPAARLFWCRHCMQIFEDPITRWRHSKTCLQSSSGKVRKDKDGSTMQVFLSSKNLSELRRDQNRSRAISRSSGPGHSPGTDLRCFICKTTFVSIEEMRSHVRTPCRKRPTIPAPKHKFATLPDDIKTQIQIPDTASEIIYIKDGHQTVISLESPCTAELIKSEFAEPSQEYEPDGISGTEEMILLPDTFDCTSNLNTIEQTVEISAVETVIPFMIRSEEVPKPPKNRTENKENNIRKRKRILPKEVDDRPNHKTNNSPKSEQQIALSLPIRPDEVKDTLEDLEVPPIKISKIINHEPEDETSQTKVRTKPLQTKEEFSQLLIAEKKDDQPFLVGGEHLLNGVITEQVADGDIYLKAPASPEEKIVTGAAAEAKLKDLFTSMEMMNKTKLSLSPKQTKTVSSPRKSPKKTGSPMKNKSRDTYRNDDLENSRRQICTSQDETIDMSGLLLYMPPINAGSVTLHDPLLDLENGLPAEMLLDETTNTKPPITATPEAINAIVSSGRDVTKLPLHIFDGDLLPSQIHSEVLFEEMIDEKEKEHPSLVTDRLVEELVSAEANFEYFVKIKSSDNTDEVKDEVEEFTTVAESDPPYSKHLEENQEIPLEESELDEESPLPITESLEMSDPAAEPNPADENADLKTKDDAEETEEASVTEKAKTETKIKSAKLFKCKACSNTFKTSQALQKHSRVPCILKHTRSLSQKILRPKQPCMKIEKKPIKKKLAKPSRRQKFMIPIMPITRSELIRPAVPKRPKRFSRRKKRRSFFIDEQNRILPYVNVIMSELSDKDRFFYKLGMINHCHKIPSSETTTTTALNAEASAVETLDESAVDSSSILQFDGTETESMDPSEIGPLSAADVAAAEPLGNAYPATPAPACVSDKENLSALAKGLCLSLPTLEKMDHARFQDPNCISPGHVKPDHDEPSENPNGATGQSLQSTCLETSPQLPVVSQIVRVTHADPSSADPLKSSTTPGSDQSDVLAESKSLASCDFRQRCKIQSKKISEEMINNYDSNISDHLTVENMPPSKEPNSKEPLGNIFENSASQPKTASLQDQNIQEQSHSEAAQKDRTNLSDNNTNKKIRPNSVSKDKTEKPKDKQKASMESKKLLKRDGVISPDKSNHYKNSTKSKLNDSQTAKTDVIKSANPIKNHNRNINKNQKQSDSDSSISNSLKTISSPLSKNVASLSSKKTTAIQNSKESVSSCKKVALKQESPIITPRSGKEVASNQNSQVVITSSCNKVPSNAESLVTSMASSLTKAQRKVSHAVNTTLVNKIPASQESTITVPTLYEKVASNQDSPMTTATSSKKVPTEKHSSPMPNISSGEKIPSNKESPITTTTSGMKIARGQESPKAKLSSPGSSISSLRDITPNQGSRIDTTNLVKKKAPSIEHPVILCKEAPPNQKSLIATTKMVSSSQESPSSTCKRVPSSPEYLRLGENRVSGHGSHMVTTTLGKAVPSSQESLVPNPTICNKVFSRNSTTSTFSSSSSSRKVISNQHSTSSSEKTEFNAGTSMKEKTNLVSVKMKDSDQNRASPICTLPAITSRLGSIVSCSPDSGSVDAQTSVDLTSQAAQMRRNLQRFREDQSGEPAAQDNDIAQPISKSLHVDVEETPKSSTDANNERHFSDIFGHEKDSLAGEDLNGNYQISPSKERSKRHFTDFLCGFSEESSAPVAECPGQRHSGSFLEKLKNIKIKEPNVSENVKTVGTSTSRNREMNSENAQTFSGIGSNNTRQVEEIPAVSCIKPVDRNSGNVRMIESCNGSVVNEKLKHRNRSPVSVECQSKNPLEELPSGESLLNSGSCDPYKTGTTTVVTVRNTAMTTEMNFGVKDSSVTNSSAVEFKAPSQNSETLLTVSTTESNPRVSISTQTNTSFLQEIKTGQSLPLVSCDDVKTNYPLSSNPDPLSSCTVSSPSTTNTIPTPIYVDNAPSPVVLQDEKCEEVVQENFHLGPSVLTPSQEIVINDTPISPGSLYPQGTICEPVQENIVLQEDNTEVSVLQQQPGTICEPVQDDSGLQADHTENNVLLQQSVLDPSSAVALESPLQQFVLDNGTDPNVLVQYLNSLDPSMVPQEVTFVIIQGSPDGEPLQLTDNYIIEQTAFSEHAEHESAGHPVIYALQPPQSDITTEAECIMTDSS